jgi:quinol monooxygenase YgiN
MLVWLEIHLTSAKQTCPYLSVEFTITPGKNDAFKNLARQLIDRTSKEPGALGYQWYFNSDEDKCQLVELYRDSASILAHLNNVGPVLQKLLETSKLTRFEVFGNVNADVEKALASFGTKFFKYFDGFLR